MFRCCILLSEGLFWYILDVEEPHVNDVFKEVINQTFAQTSSGRGLVGKMDVI